jgi:hypothetical protein
LPAGLSALRQAAMTKEDAGKEQMQFAAVGKRSGLLWSAGLC